VTVSPENSVAAGRIGGSTLPALGRGTPAIRVGVVELPRLDSLSAEADAGEAQ
jgi:hypothetical protein